MSDKTSLHYYVNMPGNTLPGTSFSTITEALTALTELLHSRCPDWDFTCFVEPENAPSIALLKKLGFQLMGYLPSKKSLLFEKWMSPETKAEIAQALTPC